MNQNDQELKIKLLEKEIEALRSVISELQMEQDLRPSELSCYIMWNAAQAFQEVRNYLR